MQNIHKIELSHSQLLHSIEEAVIDEDFDRQIVLFKCLGDYFFNQAKFEKFTQWETLVYASSSYNYALSLSNEFDASLKEIIQYNIYEIKTSFLFNRGIKYSITLQQDLLYLQERKLKLKILRTQSRTDYQQCHQNVNEIFQKMGEYLDEFFIQIFENAMQSIDINYTQHCLSIVKMCSDATNRMHYYSDLDFIILCEKESNREFIKNFTLMAYLLILELGETPLRFICIPGLECMRSYYKYPTHTHGLKFDRVSPLESKNICEFGPINLIGTPNELVNVFSRHLECQFSKKHILSIKFINTQLLYGNKFLHEEYQSLLEKKMLERNNITPHSFAEIMGSTMYEQDIHNAVFPLRDMYLFKHHLQSFEYVISSLGVFFNQLHLSQEQVVFWLVENKKISIEDGNLLLKVFEWFKKTRLEMNLVNESGNLNLPILWNYEILNKYRLKTPSIKYFLHDLHGLTELYCIVKNMAKLTKSGLLGLKNSTSLHLELNSPTPIYEVLQFISSRLTRNNFDRREFKVLEYYNKFPKTYLYPPNIIDYYKSKKINDKMAFLEKYLYVGICIANHYFGVGNNFKAHFLLNKLLDSFNQFIHYENNVLLIRLNQNSSFSLNDYSFFVDALVKLNENLPTLLATLYYMLGRCYFYNQEKHPQDLAVYHFKIAKILRQLIDVRLISQNAIINDHYNEKNMDSLLIERSGVLRMALLACDKNNFFALKKIQNKYIDLMNQYEDSINTIECQCIILRIDAYLLKASPDKIKSTNVVYLAQARINALVKSLRENPQYTYHQKVLNAISIWQIAYQDPQKAKLILNKEYTFFTKLKATQHLREKEEIMQRLSV